MVLHKHLLVPHYVERHKLKTNVEHVSQQWPASFVRISEEGWEKWTGGWTYRLQRDGTIKYIFIRQPCIFAYPLFCKDSKYILKKKHFSGRVVIHRDVIMMEADKKPPKIRKREREKHVWFAPGLDEGSHTESALLDGAWKCHASVQLLCLTEQKEQFVKN